jgi:hypothetical protein
VLPGVGQDQSIPLFHAAHGLLSHESILLSVQVAAGIVRVPERLSGSSSGHEDRYPLGCAGQGVHRLGKPPRRFLADTFPAHREIERANSVRVVAVPAQASRLQDAPARTVDTPAGKMMRWHGIVPRRNQEEKKPPALHTWTRKDTLAPLLKREGFPFAAPLGFRRGWPPDVARFRVVERIPTHELRPRRMPAAAPYPQHFLVLVLTPAAAVPTALFRCFHKPPSCLLRATFRLRL